MSQIILGQTNDVPKGVLLEQNKLILKKGKIFEETITVKLLDRVTTNLHVVSEESTQAKIIIDIEDYQATNSSYKIHLDVHQNSNLKFLFIANIHNAPSEIEFTSQSLNDSNVEFIGGFVSDKVNVKLHLDLHGKGANLKVRTIAVSSKDHEQNLDVKMIHYAPYTSAEMLNIGIAGENGIVRINGVGQIEQGMKHSSAYQTLKGIITSDLAQIDVNPILIIDEYDVKAGHAATVGKIEEEVLYYLMSRGLSKETAQKLIINGNLQPIIDEIDDELIKENVQNIVSARI